LIPAERRLSGYGQPDTKSKKYENGKFNLSFFNCLTERVKDSKLKIDGKNKEEKIE
jgi:hypothetical protein